MRGERGGAAVGVGLSVAPVFWSEVYQLGVARGVPGALYLGAAAAQAYVQAQASACWSSFG